MRIGIDIRALQEDKTTGVQVYILNLLQALFKLDNANQYVLFSNARRVTRLPNFDFPNVAVRRFRWPSKFLAASQKYLLWPKVNRMLGGIDLFFSPHWRVLALDERIPLVVTFHDLSFELLPEFFTLKQRLWHKFMDYRAAAARAQKIIAVSESTKRDLVDLYGVAKGKIEVIYPGVGQYLNMSIPRNLKRDYFLYFGTFEPRKNIEAVLTAYEEYSQQSRSPKRLVLAGSAGWKIHLPRGARVLQNVSEEEKSLLYQSAFALIFPSFYEGFGFPLLEAAAAGVPVIASFGSSLGEVGEEFALFTNPLRPAQIARAMRELGEDAQLYDSLGKAGRRVAEKFSWDRTAAAVLKLFGEINLTPLSPSTSSGDISPRQGRR